MARSITARVCKLFLISAIAEVYFDEGYKEFKKGEFHNAVYFYTEGIKVKCKDDELNSKLYLNRAAALYKQMGKICVRFLVIFLLYLMKQNMFIICKQ